MVEIHLSFFPYFENFGKKIIMKFFFFKHWNGIFMQLLLNFCDWYAFPIIILGLLEIFADELKVFSSTFANFLICMSFWRRFFSY